MVGKSKLGLRLLCVLMLFIALPQVFAQGGGGGLSEEEINKLREKLKAAMREPVQAKIQFKENNFITRMKLKPYEAGKLEKPAFASFKLDKRTKRGDVIAYTYEGVTINMNRKESMQQELKWSDLGAKAAFGVHQKIFGKSEDANVWLQVAARFYKIDGGGIYTIKALENAKKFNDDSSLKAELDDAMKEAKAQKIEDENPIWGVQTPKQRADAIEQFKKLGTDASKKIGVDLKLIETDYFLMYHDLDAKEAKKWSILLGRMYKHLCTTFGVKRGTNVWWGKCAIFIFKRERTYQQFETQVMGVPMGFVQSSMGICHSQPTGQVIIALYRQDNERDFAHVMLHEAGHGFVHRYRSKNRVASWANEGVVELVADQLTASGMLKKRLQYARSMLRAYGNSLGGDFFTASHIAGWQYGFAAYFTDFLIKSRKKRYVKAFNLMKDGMDSRDALEEAYGKSETELVKIYGKKWGVDSLRP